MRTFKATLVILALILAPMVLYGAQGKSSTDTGYLGNDQWIIDSDGDLVPATDSSQDIGASGSEVDVAYFDEIYLGGGIDAIGAVDMDYGSADVTDHTFTTDGTGDSEIVLPNNSIGDAEIDWNGLIADYDFEINGTTPMLIVGDGDEEDAQTTYDGNAQVFSAGLDDTADDYVISVGSSLGTNNAIAVDENAVTYITANKVTTETFTSSDTLGANETGKYCIVNSADTLTLPAATTDGLIYHFAAGDSVTFSVDPASTSDTIQYLELDAGDKISSAGNTGDSVTLVSDGSNSWYVFEMDGTFTDGGA